MQRGTLLTLREKAAAVRPPRTVGDQIYATLREMVVSGAVKPGGKLPSEQELREQFGVSRAAVREALSRLRAEGLVAARQGSGSYVLKSAAAQLVPLAPILGLDDLLQWLEYRSAIEAEAAQLAADRWTSADLAEIEAAMLAARECMRSGQLGGEEDCRFHAAIVQAAGNPLLVNSFGSLYPHIDSWLALVRKLQLLSPERRLAIVDEEHGAIVDAIARRQPEEAARAMRRHLRNGRERVLRGLAD